ncbi:hypothetical protein ACIRF8_18185 [Streptomyces sp. NPDC102406]|uniref:hypothetical protein n=1 Tax=Streptomyces sp. NPDC102406 TaxID=3366171 RepID=UPI0038151151
MRRRSYEALERSRAGLRNTAAGLDRSDAALRRLDVDDEHEQHVTDAEVRRSERTLRADEPQEPPAPDTDA